VAPDSAQARAGAARARKLLQERGDPIQAKLSDAMLQEIYYLAGAGKKDEARTMSQELSQRFAGTSAGREAKDLMANNFGPPRKEDALALKRKLQCRTKPAADGAVATAAKTGPAAKTDVPAAKPKSSMDLDALEAAASSEAAKLPKDGLATAFADAYKEGQAWYSKAAPGTEGNQANLLKAIEQFLRCEALFARLQTEGLADVDLQKQLQQVSMLKYGSLKMVVLAQQ
jgi:hypothetical protein